jgi:hypothetical protein
MEERFLDRVNFNPFREATLDQLQRMLNIVDKENIQLNWDWLLSWSDGDQLYTWATAGYVVGVLESLAGGLL